MRLKDTIAFVIGAGQSPGQGVGNGRATVLRFAQEGFGFLPLILLNDRAQELRSICHSSFG